MIDLPSNAVSTPVKATSASASATTDAQSSLQSNQDQVSPFQDELAREMNALQSTDPAARPAAESSGETSISRSADTGDEAAQPKNAPGDAITLILNGLIGNPPPISEAAAATTVSTGATGGASVSAAGVVPVFAPPAAVGMSAAEATAMRQNLRSNSNLQASETAATTVPTEDTSLASGTLSARAMLTGPAEPSPATVGVETVSSSERYETGRRGPSHDPVPHRSLAGATAGTAESNSVSKPLPLAQDSLRAGSALREAVPAMFSEAESAASGKIQPQGRDFLDVLAKLDSRPAQQDAPAATVQAGFTTTAGGSAQAAHIATATVPAHLASPHWDRSLGEKVVWMAGQQLQVAELHLNPPELGPLQVTLTISGNDQASAQFVSQHAAVRDAIEAAMPRLREMLADGGITLGNASVSADAFREQPQAQQESRSRLTRGAESIDSSGEFRVSSMLRPARGLVDIFA